MTLPNPNKHTAHRVSEFAYNPGNPVLHTLRGVLEATRPDPGFTSCTIEALKQWIKENPLSTGKCSGTNLRLQIQKLHDDGMIVCTVLRDGLSECSATSSTASKLHITLAGMEKLRLVDLRIKPEIEQEVATQRPGRSILSFGSSLASKPPITRAGADDFRSLPSRSGSSAAHYTGSQGMQR